LSKKKEKHTTYTIGPVSRLRLKEIMDGLWQSGGAGREALREVIGTLDPEHRVGVKGPSTILVRSEFSYGIHWYNIADEIKEGKLSEDYFPTSLAILTDEWPPFTEASYRYDLDERAIYFKGSLAPQPAQSHILYGYTRMSVKFNDRLGEKSIGLRGYGTVRLVLTETEFQFRTAFRNRPPYGVETQITDIPFSDTYINSYHNYVFYAYPGIVLFMIDNAAPGYWFVRGIDDTNWGAWLQCSPESELACQWLDFGSWTDPTRWQPPPLQLWANQTVPVAGDNTPEIPGYPYESKMFYLLSDQDGTAYIQVDLGDGVWRTLNPTGEPVTANELFSYQTTYSARFMRLRFVPAGEATVQAWGMLRT